MKTHTVEIFITVAQDTESELHEGEIMFTGEYVLRALDADGTVRHEAREVVGDLDVTTSDYARLLTLVAALERLHSKLYSGKAQYALRIVQSSKNVDGWLGHGWKRNAETVRTLAGVVDGLLTVFSRKAFVQVARAELDTLIKPSKEVISVA